MSGLLDVAIVGAGPYGLSLAATLASAGVRHRIFGVPMQTWAEHMPQGMHLKSPPFGSSLFDPSGRLTLQGYCATRGIRYQDIGGPVPLASFIAYGREFQQQLVPHLEQVEVTHLERDGGGFAVTLSTGERVTARRVVLATGIRYFGYLPEPLRKLPAEFVTHSCDHAALDKFAGRSLAVIGGGASALDFAALAAEAGARVEVFVRGRSVEIYDPPEVDRPLLKRLRAPWTGLGPGWKSWACIHLPQLFRLLPESFRLDFVRRHLGPSGDWIIKKTIEERVPVHTGMSLAEARVDSGKLRLRFTSGAVSMDVIVDHLVAGTGYRPELDRLSFIEAGLRAEIRRLSDGSPALNSNFEASVPGLYFVGLAASGTFGPVQRFVHGVEFASKRVARNLKAALAASGLPHAGAAGGAAKGIWPLPAPAAVATNPSSRKAPSGPA